MCSAFILNFRPTSEVSHARTSAQADFSNDKARLGGDALSRIAGPVRALAVVTGSAVWLSWCDLRFFYHNVGDTIVEVLQNLHEAALVQHGWKNKPALSLSEREANFMEIFGEHVRLLL